MVERVGQQLGHYHLQRVLGRGAFAEVYLAQHRYLEVPAAIKVLHVSMDQQAQEQFVREARTLARLRHPHIVRVLDFGIDDETPYLVLDYVPGGTLRTRHPKGSRLSLEQITNYVLQIAPALDYAHQQQVIHRDLKPENLLVSASGEVLLSDFGIAVVQRTLSSPTTQPPAGTPLYMAPEQIQGHPCTASDQYALGVLVYEWLVGNPPFRGSLFEVYSQHLHQPPPSLLERLPELRPAVEDAVFAALAKDPATRFVDVQEFATVLWEVSFAEASQTSRSATETLTSRASGTALPPPPTRALPTQPTPLIGREQEVALVQELLLRERVRLLTLRGPGGVGKTRLALGVGETAAPHFPDGLGFVSLASISDPALVIPTILHTLGLQEVSAQPPLEQLSALLGERQVLLLLDNFEQVMGAAQQVAELLAACPRLKLLVTSRERLHVRAEYEFTVPPLALHDLTHPPELADLSHYAAVTLFSERAQAVQPDFEITSGNAAAIAEICVRLDGLPLAIELAAARIPLLSPQALLARLGSRLSVLTSGARDAPARHQTLRHTLDWSYSLLSAHEQRLFRRLATFVGGATLEAVEAVSSAVSDIDGSVLEQMASLLDKSLLQRSEGEGEEPRFAMLETLREYGLEARRESGEAESSQRAHALYYLALAEEAEPHLKGAQQMRWWTRLEREQENLRAALSWLIGQEEGELALRLSAALGWFWDIRGYWREGGRWLEAALGLPKAQARTARRAKALHAAGVLADRFGRPVARSLFQESAAIFRELADKRGLAEALDGLAWSMSDYPQGSYTPQYRTRNESDVTGRRLLEEALALAREVGDPWLLASVLRHLGASMSYAGDFQSARLYFEESVMLLRELQDQQALSDTLHELIEAMVFAGQATQAQAAALAEESLALARGLDNRPNLSRVLYWAAAIQEFQGHPQRAVALLEESLALARELGDKHYMGGAQLTLGGLALYREDLVQAEICEQEALALFRELGQKDEAALALAHLGEIRRRQGGLLQARAACTEGLLLASEAGWGYGIGWNLIFLAKVAADEGQLEQATRLFGAAWPRLHPDTMEPLARADYEGVVEGVRARLGEQAFAEAWTQGRTLTLEQALRDG